MSAQAEGQRTIRDSLPWMTTFLRYTDDVCGAVNEHNRDWRPSDPQGNWYFSLLEQVMHIADSRHDVVGWIERGTEEGGAHQSWCTKFGSISEAWEFRPGSVAEVLESLKAGRDAIERWLDKPAGAMLEITDGGRTAFAARLEEMKKDGQDTAALEARGPAPVINNLLFHSSHEQSHRSVLQHHLRVSGNEVPRYA